MRGKVVAKTLGYVEGRITPAYAGKSMVNQPAEARLKDHPRLCGEKCDMNNQFCEFKGITPAYAGKSNGES